MRFLILVLISLGLMSSSVLANELVNYDHNLYVTRPMIPNSSQTRIDSKEQYTRQAQKRSLHAQKYARHDQKPYTLGYHERRQQKMVTYIKKVARDRS